MSKTLQICALSLFGLVVAVGIWVTLFKVAWADPQSERGPDVLVNGVSWGTEYFEGEDGHNQHAIWFNLVAKDDFEMDAFSADLSIMLGACRAVLAKADSFLADGVRVEDLDHVDINIKNDGQLALPFDMSVAVKDGACLDSINVAAFFERADPFSAHPYADEVYANFLTFGLSYPQMTFSNVNGYQEIKAAFGIQTAFRRPIESFDAFAMCVFALATLEKEHQLLLIPINPANYDAMVVSIFERSGAFFANTTVNYGSASFPLRDAKCVNEAETG